MKTAPITPHLKSIHRTIYLITITSVFLLAVRSPAVAQTYLFTTIDVPGATSPGTQASGINDTSQIVGWFNASFRDHGFLLSGGSFSTIDVPSSFNTQARGINNAGQIVGEFDSSHGFLLSGGTFTTIDVPGAVWTQASGINDSGQIVGAFNNGSGTHGFLLSGGTFTTIDAPGASGTEADGINNSGQISGEFCAFVCHGYLVRPPYGPGDFTTIDVPGPSTTTHAGFGINDSGQVVGWFGDTSGNHGYLATPDCTNQVTVNSFGAQTTTGLVVDINGNLLSLYTAVAPNRGITFESNVIIAEGLAPISEIHIKYIQNVTLWTGSVVYQPRPDLVTTSSGATLPVLDRSTDPPPPFTTPSSMRRTQVVRVEQ